VVFVIEELPDAVERGFIQMLSMEVVVLYGHWTWNGTNENTTGGNL